MTPHMRNISFALPEIYVRNITKIQDLGMVPNRSEGIRQAIRRFLTHEMENVKLFGFPGDES